MGPQCLYLLGERVTTPGLLLSGYARVEYGPSGAVAIRGMHELPPLFKKVYRTNSQNTLLFGGWRYLEVVLRGGPERPLELLLSEWGCLLSFSGGLAHLEEESVEAPRSEDY